MGALFSKFDDKMPSFYSYAEYERLANQVNQISMQVCRKVSDIAKYTNFILTVNVLSLNFDFSNWKKSQIKASLGLFPQKVLRSKLFQVEEEIQKQPKYSFKQTLELVVSMRQLYNIYDLLKFFKKQKSVQRSSLTKNPLFQQGKGCQICFDQVADLALPCGVIFSLISIFLERIVQEEKSCPMCRRQFIGRRSVIQKDLYFVIDEDESIYDQVKTCLFDILKDRNENTIRNALVALDNKNKPQV